MGGVTRVRRSQKPQGRYARASTRRTQGLRRRQPQQSGLKKMVGGLLPAAAAKRAAPSSRKGKAGGLAIAAAAAGLAFSQRDKLRRSGRGRAPTPPGTPAA